VRFPNIDWEDEVGPRPNGKVKRRSSISARVGNCSDNMKLFVLGFLVALDHLLSNHQQSMVVVADDGVVHLPLACGWIFLKYEKSTKPIRIRIVERGTHFASIGTEKCSCGILTRENPQFILRHDFMVTEGRFTLDAVRGYLNTVNLNEITTRAIILDKGTPVASPVKSKKKRSRSTTVTESSDDEPLLMKKEKIEKAEKAKNAKKEPRPKVAKKEKPSSSEEELIEGTRRAKPTRHLFSPTWHPHISTWHPHFSTWHPVSSK